MTQDLRIPGQVAQHRFEFVDDTECDMMALYESGLILRNLTTAPAPVPPTMSCLAVTSGNEQVNAYHVRGIYVNMHSIGPDPREMVRWDWIQCLVREGTIATGRVPRLVGPWLRFKLFTGTAPDGQNLLWVHNKKSAFQNLPSIDTTSHPLPLTRASDLATTSRNLAAPGASWAMSWHSWYTFNGWQGMSMECCWRAFFRRLWPMCLFCAILIFSVNIFCFWLSSVRLVSRCWSKQDTILKTRYHFTRSGTVPPAGSRV